MRKSRAIHDPVVRITHWVGAAAMLCMIFSGWQIYNASPVFAFQFPRIAWSADSQFAVPLGGWLGGGIAWHLAAMWVLVADGLVYLVWGFASGHFRRDLWPVSPRQLIGDLRAALTLRLRHQGYAYNAVQKAFYIFVLCAAVLAVLSGLAIWKPVQLSWLTALMGDYDNARIVHFCAMTAISLFVVVHLVLVAIVPSTLRAMILGGRRREQAP